MNKGYIIKQTPEDFIVKEISSIKLEELEKKGEQIREYTIFLMKKTSYTTERAVQQIADSLHIPRKRLGYAGNKDKIAVTEQYISLRNVKKERVEALKLKDIELKFIGYSKDPLSLGDLEGNSFEIVVRNLSKTAKSPICLKRIVNYFGEQRFSTNNADVGKAIIKKDFKKAVDRVIEHIGEQEKKVIEHLEKNKSDFVGALKTLPWKTLKLYVHAYQSKLWNDVAEELVKQTNKASNKKSYCIFKEKNFEEASPAHEDPLKNIKIPLIGFATEVKDKELKQVVDKIMQNEQISYNDFIIRAIPDLSTDGTERDLYAEVKDISIGKLKDDELNKGKKRIKIKFFLQKGSYATEAIKQMLPD